MAQHIIPHSTPKAKKPVYTRATGKRKTSIARVRLVPGTGVMTVNKRPLDVYFGRKPLQLIVNQPFEATNTLGQFDTVILVTGGGSSGQAGAVRHGIARALMTFNPDHRKSLKAQGYITRDAREKERRKVGCRKARRRQQYSKR